LNFKLHQSYSAFVIISKMLISFLILSYSIHSWAYEPSEGNVSIFLGPYIYKTNFKSTSTGATSPNLGGAGLVVLGDVNDKGSLEIGLFYLNKIFFRELAGQYIAEQTGVTQVTMGYRRWWNNWFSSSLSFYSAYSIGAPEIVHNDFAPGTEIDTSARDTTEYGFDLSLQTNVYEQGKWALDLDTRYSYSVTPKANENSDHYGVLLGLRYMFQEK
jgi:hypothetical protein